MNDNCPNCGELAGECAAKFLREYAHAEPKTRGLPESKGIIAIPYIFWPAIVELMTAYAGHVLHSNDGTSGPTNVGT
jgi:hypothetical protein